MPADAPYVESNDRERARMRAIVDRVVDEQLRLPVNEHWTVAGVLGHIGFWDARALALAERLEHGKPFTPDDDEPEDVDWINDASRPLIHAIDPRRAAEVAMQLAEETDRRMASLDPARMWPAIPTSPLNPFRSAHRGEHLDDIEAALELRGESSPGGEAG